MSDTHDNIWNLEDALAVIKVENAGIIIHCGDFIAPFMLKELDKANIPVYGVLGNNDGSQQQQDEAVVFHRRPPTSSPL